jgi:putative transcriptional regulator
MDKANFEQLVKGINDMRRHLAGKRVRGARTTRVDATDIQAIRQAANLSQTRFAKLIGVNVRTLQNWEQGRTRPTGPARALLKIVASSPKAALEALHA